MVKVGFKYSSLMPFIQLSEEDVQYKRMEELRYTGWLIGGLLGGAILGMLLRRYLNSFFTKDTPVCMVPRLRVHYRLQEGLFRLSRSCNHN